MEKLKQLSRFGLFDTQVPRYTSYPTAPQFSDAFGADFFESCIRALKPGSEVSLYLHIPFCRRLCWFCACRTQGTRTDAPVRSYLDTLIAEIELLGKTLPANVRLSRMHWGGGTPTLLQPEMITELAEAVAYILPFAENAEFSVEIDPNEIDEQRLKALSAAGMTRASIGIQDFNPDIQNIIGRQQSYEITKEAAEAIRAHGITSLNTDILYGLPNQTRARISGSVQKLLTLSPDRVALYGYAHVPWMAKRQQMIPSDALPTPQERLALYETARELFIWDNYEEIGIDHFARPEDGLAKAHRAGKLRRNFQGYTDDQSETLIGLGASAISKFAKGYAQNTSATGAYAKQIRSGSFATSRGHAFRGEDKMRARMIEALMCDFRIDLEEIAKCFGKSRAELDPLLKEVEERFDGMVALTDEAFLIRNDGRPLTRVIARAFDAYDLSKAGHSSAV